MGINDDQQIVEPSEQEVPLGSKKEKQIKKAQWWQALIVLAILIASISVGVLVFETDPHIPLMVGVLAAAVMALVLGYKWSHIEQFMMNGITKSLQSIVILVLIGVLVGVWVVAGVVPTMIYYGLAILKPAIFYLSALIICSITSLATGTSWGTMGTMGIALIGIATGLNMNIAITAGAIISGAYFGDKLSPLSDTTNLAPSMAGTDVMTHIKHMLPSTGIVYGITAIFFLVVGLIQYKGGNADLASVEAYRDTIKATFTINPVLFIPPLVVIVSIALKMPAIPGLTLGIVSGAICSLIFQNGCNLGSIFDCGINGYEFIFENDEGILQVYTDIAAKYQLSTDAANELFKGVSKLLSTGGILNMASSITMVIIAMMFGGIMEETGLLASLVNGLKRIARRPGTLVTVTELTCIASNAIAPEQYISIIIPGRMFADEYDKQGLSPSTLSNALECSGTVSSALIPWNTCGAYIEDVLLVSTPEIGVWGNPLVSYGPWAVFNWLMPLVTIAFAYLGLNVKDKNGVSLFKKRRNNIRGYNTAK